MESARKMDNKKINGRNHRNGGEILIRLQV